MKKLFAIVISIFIASLSFAGTNINAEDAANHLGETVTVCTKVYGVKTSSKGMELFVGAAFPKHSLTVTVTDTKAAKGQALKERFICVTGTVKGSKANPELVVSKESDIIVRPSEGGDIGFPDPGNRYFLPIY